VARIYQCLAQIIKVYPLSTGKGLAAIAQQRYPQWLQGYLLGRGARACRRWLRSELRCIKVPDDGFPSVVLLKT
jgi:hypothetical protein